MLRSWREGLCGIDWEGRVRREEGGGGGGKKGGEGSEEVGCEMEKG